MNRFIRFLREALQATYNLLAFVCYMTRYSTFETWQGSISTGMAYLTNGLVKTSVEVSSCSENRAPKLSPEGFNSHITMEPEVKCDIPAILHSIHQSSVFSARSGLVHSMFP